MRVRIVLLAFVASIALAAAPAAADQTHILTAAKWSRAQTAAVVAAGGIVTFSQANAGVAIATSSNPDFIALALRGGAVKSAVADVEIALPPMPVVSVEEAGITPGDETFWAYQWAPRPVLAPEAWAAGCTGAGVPSTSKNPIVTWAAASRAGSASAAVTSITSGR